MKVATKLTAHPESYGHWGRREISDLLHQRDALRKEKDKLAAKLALAAENEMGSEELINTASRLLNEAANKLGRNHEGLCGEIAEWLFSHSGK